MNFKQAMGLVGQGGRVRRLSWKGSATIQSAYAVMFNEDGAHALTRFLCRVNCEGQPTSIPMSVTNEDMAATDWVVLP